MTKINPENERIKCKYFAYEKEAHGKSPKTVENMRKAIIRYEEFTKHEDLKSFNQKKAVVFKAHLLKTKNRHGEPLSASTIAHTLRPLQDFFKWLATQTGYKTSIRYSCIEYLNLNENDKHRIQTVILKEYPSEEQIRKVIAAIPNNNDLDGDSDRFLKLNNRSQFFSGLEDLEMETRIRRILNRYADFDFTIKYEFDDAVKKQKMSEVRFSRETPDGDSTQLSENIKVSRGEENLFVWCFFLAIVELAMDKEIEAYSWVKYVYIDDPISSLDENNAIAVGHHLAQLLKENKSPLKAVISSHHALFFNVLCNEFKNQFTKKNPTASKYFISGSKGKNSYTLINTSDTPFFYHVAMLAELYKAAQTEKLYTYHFSILRTVLEKTASFHGHDNFSACIKKADDDVEGVLHKRLIDIMNHGNYSHYEPQEMLQENKEYFKKILEGFLEDYNFNTSIFPKLVETQQEEAA